MPTLKNLVDEVVNIKDEIVECRDILKAKLISKKVEVTDNENRLSVLINKIDSIETMNMGLWLYKEGDEYTSITGGWKSFDAWTGGGKFNETIKNKDHLYVAEIYDCIGFVCEKVDFTYYNKLYVDVEIVTNTDNSSMSAVIKDSYPYNANYLARVGTSELGKQTLSLDISKITGVHKLTLESYTGTTSTAKFEFKVYKVWLEV